MKKFTVQPITAATRDNPKAYLEAIALECRWVRNRLQSLIPTIENAPKFNGAESYADLDQLARLQEAIDTLDDLNVIFSRVADR